MKPIVDCPDGRRLSDLLDGMASDADQAEMTRHLDDCPRCQQRLETLAIGGGMPADVTRLGRWRREAGPALVHAMTVLTENRDLDTVVEDEVIFEFLTPSDRCGSLGRFGAFEILEILGHGGMGIVLKALDTELNRIVALKVLAPQLAASASARKRFAREARAAAAITHPNVVSIYTVDIERGLPYLVMEYVPGESLQQRLDRDGPLPVEDILQLAIQIADGLAAAHERGIVHRDLKPGNVLLSFSREPLASATCEDALARGSRLNDGPLKLTDFGLARSLDDGVVTQSGFLPGTPAYMAPEQARGERADARSDLFSLGSVMYAMATGHAPFRASTLFALLRRVSEDEPLSVEAINPLVPKWLGEIMKKLHAKDPERRFQSASETATVLRECLAHVRQPAQTPLPWFLRPLSERRRPRRSRAVAGVLALIAVIGVGLAAAGVFRVKTTEGTLIVEVSDPKVNVTVDGKDVIISGEGIAEMRLRTGQYRLEVSKDGKQVLTRLVDIKKDGKEVVRVSLEPPAHAAAATAAPLTLSGHKGEVQAVAFSPDGKRIVSAGKDQAVRLWDVETGKQVMVREKAGPVLAVSFFPDGKVLVTIAADGTVQLWDVATGKVLTSVKLPGTIKLSAVDLPSKTIVSSSDGTLKLWDMASGKERTSLEYDDVVRALAFSPDARSLAVAGSSGVTLWDVSSGKQIVRVHHDPVIRSLAFSPDGKRLIVSGDDVRVWDAATGKALRSYWKTTRPTATVQSPDGQSVATGDADGAVTVVNLGTGEVLFSHREQAGPITALAFSPDGKRLAWTTPEGDIRLAPITGSKAAVDDSTQLEQLKLEIIRLTKELQESRNEAARQRDQAQLERARALLQAREAERAEREAREQAEHQRAVAQRLLYLKSIQQAQAAWKDGQARDAVKLLDSMPEHQRHWEWHYLMRLGQGGETSQKLEGHRDGIRSVVFSPDGKRIASGSYDFTTRLWDVATGKTLMELKRNEDTVDSVAFSPDGKRLASAGQDGHVNVCDTATGKTVLVLPQGEKGPCTVKFSPDNRLLAWGMAKGELKVYDAATSQLVYQVRTQGGAIRAISYSPDGKLLAFAGVNVQPRLIDASSGKVLREFRNQEKIYTGIAFSPDGKHLAVSGNNGVWVMDVATGKVLYMLTGHSSEVNGVAFSPDGKRLATCGMDGTIRLWDAATGQAVLTLTGDEKGISSVAFSPDGKQLVSGGLDNSIRIWPGTQR